MEAKADFNSIKQCMQFILWLFGDAYCGYMAEAIIMLYMESVSSQNCTYNQSHIEYIDLNLKLV